MNATLEIPDSMDKWARNQRLCAFLKDMGLVVEPVYADTTLRRIDYLKVSVAFPITHDLPEAK